MGNIKLEKDDILRLGILDENGNDTGSYLEFDFNDPELLLRYKNVFEKELKNRQWVTKQLDDISKKKDIKGLFISKNEEDELKVLNEFYKREREVYDMFLGEGGCDKLLNGRKFGWTSPRKISKIIEEQIKPYFETYIDKMEKDIEDMFNIENSKNVI